MESSLFVPWPKTPRGGAIAGIITEKMDGTNACVIVQDGKVVGVQSRRRMITPEDDNYGFAAWVEENKEELGTLGDGYHYGEWVGPGIQKNPHNLEQKEFYLFDTMRFCVGRQTPPKCVKVVRELYVGPIDDWIIESEMVHLAERGEDLDYKPEGIIVYYFKTKSREKYTFANSKGKWQNIE